MGWLWSSDGDKSSKQDPLTKLDPTLREFLDNESASQAETTTSKPSNDRSSGTYRSQLGLDQPGLDQVKQNSTPTRDESEVPPESLFQDGRYAHLWKGYRPLSEIESAGSTDQDRLAAVVEAYNDRKAAIGRAAVENCVELQIAEKDCFSNGGWAKRMTMCREESKAFNRCYTMQSRFLKALGYLAQQRTEDEEERIQMHADKLYHEMLERERMAEEARKLGQESPELPSLLQADSTQKALGEDSAWARARRTAAERGISTNLSSYTPEKQEQIKERIKNLPEAEKELELQLIAAESRAQLEYADQIRQRLEEERVNRADRRARGKETIGDTIKRLWGWDT